MSTNMEISSSYTTKDFNLAAFLWSYQKEGRHAELEKSRPTQEGKDKVVLYFTFKLPLGAKETDQLVMDYYNGKCMVEPCEFAKYQGRLKDLIYSQKS